MSVGSSPLLLKKSSYLFLSPTEVLNDGGVSLSLFPSSDYKLHPKDNRPIQLLGKNEIPLAYSRLSLDPLWF